MQLTGTRFGAMEYREQDRITLPEGLVGMPNLRQFLIADFEEKVPFRWLQSVDDPSVGFLIAEPALFEPEFSLGLTESDLRGLDVSDPEELGVFVLCTFRGSWQETTGNLMGPVLVHAGSRRGRQVIVEDSGYSTHEPLRALLSGEELEAVQRKVSQTARRQAAVESIG
ncbi:MAG: flagellar assembly protein FliW [Candidatus Krumholzibacteriia bacterium]|nr:flagellar assembly protein FliW [bacterium]MCB9515220.1 flagellar assembly protein FliW [Candidatus Latescibacterota bacterium]